LEKAKLLTLKGTPKRKKKKERTLTSAESSVILVSRTEKGEKET